MLLLYRASSVLPKQRIQARFISGLRQVSEETKMTKQKFLKNSKALHFRETWQMKFIILNITSTHLFRSIRDIA